MLHFGFPFMPNCPRASVPLWLVSLPLLMAILATSRCLAQQETPSPWQRQVEEFVQEIVARSGSPSAVTLNFDNVSGLAGSDQDSLKREFLTTFRNAGLRLVKPELAAAEIHITFSEDWQNYLWVAEIRQGTGSQIIMKKVARPQRPAGGRAPALTIRRSLIWQQDGPVLDFLSDGRSFFVLEPEQIAIYGNESGKWQLKHNLAISHPRPWPRDLRGRLQLNGMQMTAFLPGTLCSGTTSPPAMQCRASDDPWQVDQGLLAAFFSPARNFFTGVLAGPSAGESVPPFFSGAAMQNGNTRQWIFAGTDGRARLFIHDLAAPWATLPDWGSNIAAVQSGCGTGWQILTSFPNDLTHADAVQAMEVQNREAVSVSSPVELSGPILAFWPGENSQTAHAVVQSLASGKYEEWAFTVSCN